VTPVVHCQSKAGPEGYAAQRLTTCIQAAKLQLLPSEGCLAENMCPALSSYLHSSFTEVVSLFYFILSSISYSLET